jgi:hypothetical protein
MQKYQWILFWLVCGAIAVVLSFRLLMLMPLYTDSALRSRTQVLLKATAAREGWLLSGVSIERITDENIRVVYRSYNRGRDTEECFVIDQKSGSLGLCNAS